MISILKRAFDSYRGAGESSITVPPLDGALRANNDIEEADALFSIASPDNIASDGITTVFSSDGQVLALENVDAARVVARFDARVSALGVRGGLIAVGLASGGIAMLGGGMDGKRYLPSEQLPINCPTALTFLDSHTLLVANGSSAHGPDFWKHDLMERNVKGSVWSLDLRTGAGQALATGLAYPNGLAQSGDGRIVVSEAWLYRLVTLGPKGSITPVLRELPGYPGRIAPAPSDDGYWLPIFAPRRRLVELVLRERAYRKRMMAEIPSDYWISPSLRPMSSYLEPLQGGTLKKLARLKPWAPSRSYGLIVRLDRDFQPVGSFHSRADGTRHGISSCVVKDGRLLAASVGGDVLVSMDPKGY